MMIQWWMIIGAFLIEYSSVKCLSNQCNYLVNKRDNSSDRCVGDQCHQFIDLVSIMVEPKTCKTSSLSLSFSSYQNFRLFRDRLLWKIGDLFSSQSKDEDRQLILFVNQLDFNDRPFDYDQLTRLGMNIDFYTLFIENIENKDYLRDSIHYHPNDPLWNIIKIKFRCRKLSAFDRYPCSSEIISPSQFAPQRTILPTLITDRIDDPVSSTDSIEELSRKSKEEKRTSIDLIFLISISIGSIFITMGFFILIYLKLTHKFCFKRDMISTPSSLSRTDKPNDSIEEERNSCAFSIFDNTIVRQNQFNFDQIQSHPIHIDHPHCTNNLNNNYEKVPLDQISIIGHQYFVPILYSRHF